MEPKVIFDPEATDEDNPELDEAFFAEARPAVEVDPEGVAAFVAWQSAHADASGQRRPGQRGPQRTPTKEQVTLRLDRDLLSHFRASGPCWQSRLNDALRRSVGI